MDLEQRFLALAKKLKVKKPEEIFRILTSFYKEPNRLYHTLAHIEFMLSEFDHHKSSLDWADAVEWAIFWHDAFYNTHLDDVTNVKLSASMAIASPQMSKEFTERVDLLILATTHAEEPKISDAKYMCDFDLAILGQDFATYVGYRDRIRHEYAWVPIDTYRVERIKVLQALLDRERIYYTRPYRSTYESAAKENLKEEIRILS